MIKIEDFEVGKLSWIIHMGPTWILKFKKAEKLSRLWSEGDVTAEEWSETYTAGFEKGGRELWTEECVWPLESGKNKEIDYLLEFPEGMQCC